MEVEAIIPTAQGTHTEIGFVSNTNLFNFRANGLFPTSSDYTFWYVAYVSDPLGLTWAQPSAFGDLDISCPVDVTGSLLLWT